MDPVEPVDESGGRRRRWWSGLRSKILLKVLVALMLNLVVASAVTEVVSARLTHSALRGQAQRVATSQLGVVEAAYQERETTLVASLRYLAQVLVADHLTGPGRRRELIAELGRSSRNLDLDALHLLDGDGRPLVPPVGVGEALAPPSEVPTDDAGLEPGSRLLATRSGRYVQAVLLPVGADGRRYVLAGGYELADAFAYRLRRQAGTNDHVIVVAGGRVVGSTLPRPPLRPPGAVRAGELPRVPTTVQVGGAKNLVVYVPVRSPGGAQGALGVALPDPVARLDRSLSDSRLATSIFLTGLALILGWLLFRVLTRPLVGLARTSARIAAGDLDASFEVRGRDEIGALGGSLERMRLELRTKLELIGRQAASIQESSKRIVAAQDEERHRLARDLHDGIQQQLVVLRMGMGMAREAAGRDPATAGAHFDDLARELDAVIQRLREVSHDLYPSILLDRGLTAALHSYVGRLPLSSRLECDPDPLPRLAPEVENGAYFLLSEALCNAIKHADAGHLLVSLSVRQGWLAVSVSDDGRGFDVAAVSGRGGLLHMEDRVRSFGGDLQITSAEGQGTTVLALFPLSDAERPAPDAVAAAPRT